MITAQGDGRLRETGRRGRPWASLPSSTAGRRAPDSAIVFAVLGRHVPENAVIAVDVGNRACSFGRYFETKRGRSVLVSGYLGSIGRRAGDAIGAWAPAPDRPIFAVTGDGRYAEICEYGWDRDGRPDLREGDGRGYPRDPLADLAGREVLCLHIRGGDFA